MKYLSVCSGIEAATVAWHPLGWSPVAFAEIEKFPSAVLAHHYPSVPNLGDMTKFKDWPDVRPSILVGGTPCQSFSVAGLRKGMDDPRGNLALTYLAILDRYQPEWCIWENVPGVLSSSEGRDFGAFLGGLAELGYGFAYRVLDAQYVRVDGFGRAVPQRRRRVFVVGNLGDWRCAAAVLFERESLSGHTAPRRETGERVAPTISARPTGGGGLGTDFDCDGGLVPSISHPLLAKGNDSFDDSLQSYVAGVAPTLNAHFGDKQGLEDQHVNGGCGLFVAHALRGEGFDASEDGTGRGTPLVPVPYSITPSNSNEDYNARLAEKAQALTANGNRPSARGGDLIAFSCKDHGGDAADNVSPTLRAGGFTGSGVMPAIAFQARIGRNGRGYSEGVSLALNGADAGATSDMRPCVAIQERAICENPNAGPDGIGVRDDGTAYTLEARTVPQAVATAWAVRRLTPRECERLQGFPDNYTNIPWRGKSNAPDGPRYKALGNSMAVNCMRWLGQRILMVQNMVEADRGKIA